MLTKDRKILRSRFENSFALVSERIGIGVFDERAKKPIKKPGFGFFLFGVILPALALYFEICTHTMAGVLFDPFPTPWHVLLFSFIPLSNLIVFLAVRFNMVSFYAITSLMSGFAMGIAILYSLMFATKLPAIGSTFIHHSELSFLIIFHPLLYAPLFAIAPLFNAGHVITLLAARQKAFFDGDQLKHFGHIVILIMVLSIEAPSTITRIYLSKAINYSNSAKLINGFDSDSINWLRSWGNREVMLRACYERSGRATDILGSFYEDQHPVPIENARELFYVVTGQAFNEVAIPASFRSTLKHTGAMHDASGLNGNADDEFDIDTDIAGSKVSGFARGLSTSDSAITGKIDPKAQIASLDWRCTLENATYVPREARAQIKLPPGACVSGATIWLDGKKKEAQIDERSQARSTYVNAVYTNKKDPLLVSMHGPSTVLVQCYPVVRGQITKVDLHIVAPLQSFEKNKAQLVLPVFGERNFAFKNENKIKLDCATKFDIKNNLVEFDSSSQIPPVFQQINSKPDTLYVVVDGSVKMQPYMSEVAEGLKSLPIQDVHIFKVLDGQTNYKNAQDAIKDLSVTKCTGGQDNSRTLADSMNKLLFKVSRPSAILWIHGPQPVCDSNSALYLNNIIRELKDSNRRKVIYDYQVVPGSNKLLESMDFEQSASGTREITSTGHPKVDLEHFWTTLQKTEQTSYHDFTQDKNASADLNILRAYSATMANFALYGYQNPTLYLCRKYHFVSPVTSFVVHPDEDILETTVCEEPIGEEVTGGKNEKSDICQNMIQKTAQNLHIVTAIGPIMQSTNSPEQRAKDQEYSSTRELKECATSSSPAAAPPGYPMASPRRKAQAGAGGGFSQSVSGSLSNKRYRQNTDAKLYADSAKKGSDAPTITDERDSSSVNHFSNSVTDKLNSLSQAASQAGPSPMESSSEQADRQTKNHKQYLFSNFVSTTKIYTFIIFLTLGLIVIGLVKSGRLRK
ncbi:MAG: VIT domain-containing protein [Candidatus Melainabacteria bacterium]|nr:VIT domain-containing protein [Candidatus Melainabacteria bacterium]